MNMVFVHGLAGDPHDFSPVAAHLSGLQLHAPRCDYLQGDADSLEALAQDVEAGLPPRFRQDGYTVVGNSLGGLLALVMAGNADRAALIAPHVATEFRFLGRGRDVFQRELHRIFHDPGQLQPQQVERYESKWRDITRCRKRFSRLRQLKRMIELFDPSPWYEGLQHRLFMICGRHDRVSPVARLAALKKRYPAMDFRVLPRCGHAVPLERPLLLARTMARAWGLALA